MIEGKGLLASLFDLSFSEFVTTRLVKILFILAILLAALGALAPLLGALASGQGSAILVSLIMAPIVFVISVLAARVWLELVIVVFRIAENTAKLVEQEKAA